MPQPFPVPVVESFEDVTLDFEFLGTHSIFDSTAAGGDLTGVYPNPTLAAATKQGFVQLPVAANLQVQTGSTTIALSTGVFNGFALPVAWSTVHTSFVASVTPGPAAPSFAGSVVHTTTPLTAGMVYFVGTNGTYNLNWISFGH